MKTLRYLLITFAVMIVMSVSAQSLAQEPQIGFQSTSSMVGSGSALPQAAQYGVYTTYDQGYSASRANKPGINRAGGGSTGESGGETPPPEREDPYEDPIGDAAWPLLALALGYAAFAAWRKQRVKESKR